MYKRRVHSLADPAEIRRLIDDYPWAVLVAHGDQGLVASHLPCLRDPVRDGDDLEDLVILGHVAKRDPIAALLEEAEEALLIFQGSHGYVSPSWYGESPHVGTWNFTAAHVYGAVET
ncbi:MAG: FMN-binding negative transcriptional regulator, partial [Actinomycetota bacterium]|nr:FMN-binding negative transcriptional regulator [Actinomycetota bacterium]